MSPVRSFLPAWADGLKRGCGGQQGWRSQDRAALDSGLEMWNPKSQGGSSPPVAPAAGWPAGPASAALQKEKQPKRRTPPAEAAGLRALPLEPGLQIPRTLHLPISAKREVQAPPNRGGSRRGAPAGQAPGPSFWPPN